MLRESLRHLCRKAGWDEKRAFQISGLITYVLIMVIALQLLMPYMW